jgi:hypothetical protein
VVKLGHSKNLSKGTYFLLSIEEGSNWATERIQVGGTYFLLSIEEELGLDTEKIQV